MNKRQKSSLARRVLALSDKARTLYQKKDDLFGQLLAGCRAGEVIETKNGLFEIVDNFAARNVSFRPASFHRYELKEVKGAKIMKKPAALPAPIPVEAPEFAEAAKEPAIAVAA